MGSFLFLKDLRRQGLNGKVGRVGDADGMSDTECARRKRDKDLSPAPELRAGGEKREGPSPVARSVARDVLPPSIDSAAQDGGALQELIDQDFPEDPQVLADFSPHEIRVGGAPGGQEV